MHVVGAAHPAPLLFRENLAIARDGSVAGTTQLRLRCHQRVAVGLRVRQTKRALTVVDGQEEVGENQRDNGHELHHNVEGWAGRVLEGITNGVTDDGGLVGIRTLLEHVAIVIKKLTLLDVLLRVVPSTTRVGLGDGHLNGGNEGAGEEAAHSLNAEEDTGQDRSQDDQESRRDHLLQGSISGDGNAEVVVGLDFTGHDVGVLTELASHFLNHLHGSLTDGLHRHSSEEVGEHASKEKERECHGLQHVDAGGRKVGARDEGAEERERDESGRANGETLADSGSGVASSVKGVGLITDSFLAASHLGDTAGVVADWAVNVNGEAGGQDGQHTEGGKRHAEHSQKVERHVDDDGQDDDRDDDGLVTKGQTVDDVGGSAGLGGGGKLLRGLVRLGGVELGDETDHAAAPEATDDGDESVEGAINDVRGAERVGDGVGDVDAELVDVGEAPHVAGRGAGEHGSVAHETVEPRDGASLELFDDVAVHGELLGQESGADRVQDSSHDDGGGEELHLEHGLDVGVVDLDLFVVHKLLVDGALHSPDVGGDEAGQHADWDTDGGDVQREDDGGETLRNNLGRKGGDDQGSAGGLAEGTEKVGSHTSDITDVVTDVVSDDGGVAGIVFGQVLDDLTGKVSADISGLGVDTAANATEKSNSGSAKTVAGQAFEELRRVGQRVAVLVEGEDAGDRVDHVVDADEDVAHEERDAAERVSHDAAGAERGVEAVAPGLVLVLLHGLFGGAGVGEDGDHHSNVTRGDGSQRANDEGSASEATGHAVPLGVHVVGVGARADGEVLGEVAGLRCGVDGARVRDEHANNGAEDGNEDEAELVLGPQEGLGTALDDGVDVDHLGHHGGLVL